MRFKPPPPNSKIGWRVEFRPTECQLTDFENAALTVFVVMLTRVILSYNLNLLIPISRVDENIRRAQTRDACTQQKFFWRRSCTTDCSPPEVAEVCKRYETNGKERVEGCLQELTVTEIINGKSDTFTGLVPFIRDYMANLEVDVATRCTVNQYLDFISARASGKLMTTARYCNLLITNWVTAQPGQ